MKITLLAITLAGGVTAASAASNPPRKATFEARHEVKVLVPEGAKAVRVWLAMPQDDPIQTVPRMLATWCISPTELRRRCQM